MLRHSQFVVLIISVLPSTTDSYSEYYENTIKIYDLLSKRKGFCNPSNEYGIVQRPTDDKNEPTNVHSYVLLKHVEKVVTD